MSGLREVGQDRSNDPGGVHQRFRAVLHSYFVRRVHDGQVADQLTREAFVRLTDAPVLWRGHTPEAQLFKIASAVLQDYDRHCATRQAASAMPLAAVSETLGRPFVPLDEHARNLAFAARAALRDLEKALAGLSKRTREIFLLSRVENVSHQEIASMHRISVACVDKHVRKALAHLTVRAYRP